MEEGEEGEEGEEEEEEEEEEQPNYCMKKNKSCETFVVSQCQLMKQRKKKSQQIEEK